MKPETMTSTIDEILASSTISPVYFGYATERVSMVRRRNRPPRRRRGEWFAIRRNRRAVAVFTTVTAPTVSPLLGDEA